MVQSRKDDSSNQVCGINNRCHVHDAETVSKYSSEQDPDTIAISGHGRDQEVGSRLTSYDAKLRNTSIFRNNVTKVHR